MSEVRLDISYQIHFELAEKVEWFGLWSLEVRALLVQDTFW